MRPAAWLWVFAVCWSLLGSVAGATMPTVAAGYRIEVYAAVPSPTGLAFPPVGSAFGTDLYFADMGDGCSCIRRLDAQSNVSAPFVFFYPQDGWHISIGFGKGDAC